MDRFFLESIIKIANEAIDVVGKIAVLREKDMEKIQALRKRTSESAIKILLRLFAQSIATNVTIKKWTSYPRPGAQTIIKQFIDIQILKPKDKDRKYGKSYVYKKYLDIFINN